MGSTGNPRYEHLRALHGQKVILPGLREITHRWVEGTSPHKNRLVEEADRIIEQYFSPGPARKKLKQSNGAQLGAGWYPYASFDRLLACSCLLLWLFIWDDEMDSAEINSLNKDPEQAARYVEQTKEFVHRCIMMGNKDLDELPGSKIPSIAFFKCPAENICPRHTLEQNKLLLDQVYYFIDSSFLELQIQSSNKLPSVEEYTQRRLGSSGDGVVFAVTEYALEIEMPRSVLYDANMLQAWDMANLLIAFGNDIHSIQKELEVEQFDSLVPLLYVKLGSLQTALDQARTMIQDVADEFDLRSKKLLENHADDPILHDKIEKFLHGLEYGVTGYHNFALHSPRYRLPEPNANGDYEILIL